MLWSRQRQIHQRWSYPAAGKEASTKCPAVFSSSALGCVNVERRRPMLFLKIAVICGFMSSRFASMTAISSSNSANDFLCGFADHDGRTFGWPSRSAVLRVTDGGNAHRRLRTGCGAERGYDGGASWVTSSFCTRSSRSAFLAAISRWGAGTGQNAVRIFAVPPRRSAANRQIAQCERFKTDYTRRRCLRCILRPIHENEFALPHIVNEPRLRRVLRKIAAAARGLGETV